MLLCALAAFVACGVVDVAQFQDPFVRHDDFCVALGDADAYYGKTLSEGRWLNWVWALRPGPFNLHVLWYSYMAAWALFSGVVGASLAPRGRAHIAVFLAVTIAFAPQMANMSRWFGTMVPGIAIMAAYAAIAAFGSPRARTVALFVFVPLGLMTHGGSPLIMVAVALGLGGWSGALAELAVFALAFVAAFAESIGLIYTLNYFAHGHFGVAIAEWRHPSPAASLGEVLQRIASVGSWLIELLTGMTHLPATHIAPVALVAAVALGVRAPSVALRLALALALGTAINGAIVVSTGIATPFRGTYFLWPIAVIGVYQLARATPSFIERGLSIALLCFLFLIGGFHLYLFDGHFSEFQVDSRALADTVKPVFTAPDEPLYVLGDPRELPHGGYVVFSSLALQYRLALLLDRKIVVCFNAANDCAFLEPQRTQLPAYPAPGAIIHLPDSGVVVRLADTPADADSRLDIEPGLFR